MNLSRWLYRGGSGGVTKFRKQHSKLGCVDLHGDRLTLSLRRTYGQTCIFQRISKWWGRDRDLQKPAVVLHSFTSLTFAFCVVAYMSWISSMHCRGTMTICCRGTAHMAVRMCALTLSISDVTWTIAVYQNRKTSPRLSAIQTKHRK